jgi:hypothetical protein
MTLQRGEGRNTESAEKGENRKQTENGRRKDSGDRVNNNNSNNNNEGRCFLYCSPLQCSGGIIKTFGDLLFRLLWKQKQKVI